MQISLILELMSQLWLTPYLSLLRLEQKSSQLKKSQKMEDLTKLKKLLDCVFWIIRRFI